MSLTEEYDTYDQPECEESSSVVEGFPLSHTQIEILRTKSMVHKLSMSEVDQLLDHIEALESALDITNTNGSFDYGWRHYLGIEEQNVSQLEEC